MKKDTTRRLKRISKMCGLLLLTVGVLAGMSFMLPAAAGNAVCINEDLIQACDAEGHVNVETAMGDMVTDAFRWYFGADVAFAPSADLANHLQQGTLTRENIANALERDSATAAAEMTPAQIYGYLETSISYIIINKDYTIDWENSYADGYLQVSGVRVRYDTAAPVGERVMDLYLSDGTVLNREDDSSVYRVAATKELFDGGFGYAAVDVIENGGTETDVVSGYLSSLGTVGIPEDMNRTRLLGTREIVSGYGRVIGAVIGLFGLIITGTVITFKKRLKRKKEEYGFNAEQYEIDK